MLVEILLSPSPLKYDQIVIISYLRWLVYYPFKCPLNWRWLSLTLWVSTVSFSCIPVTRECVACYVLKADTERRSSVICCSIGNAHCSLECDACRWYDQQASPVCSLCVIHRAANVDCPTAYVTQSATHSGWWSWLTWVREGIIHNAFYVVLFQKCSY